MPNDTFDQAASGQMTVDVAVAIRTADDADRVARLAVAGWIIGTASVERIDLLHRGEFIATAVGGLARPDIGQLFPDYEHADYAGFSLNLQNIAIENLDLNAFSMEATFVDGTRITSDVALSEQVESPGGGQVPIRFAIDRASVTPQGILSVEGWAASSNPLVAIQIWLNNRRLGAAQLGRPRPDVGEQFPEYSNAANAGFLFVGRIPEDEVPHAHSIRIEAIAVGGISRSTLANVQRSDALAPSEELTHEFLQFEADDFKLGTDGTIFVNGWALADSGIAQIGVTLDGKEVGSFKPNVERADVAQLYPHIAAAQAPGFNVIFETGISQEGEHSLGFEVETMGGNSRAYSFMVKAGGYAVAAPTPAAAETAANEVLLNIDSPKIANGIVREPVSDALELSGWALAESGIDEVNLFVDGEPMGVAYYGTRRLDIEAAFPTYEGSLLSGYAMSLPASAFENGEHEFSVVAKAKNGSTNAVNFIATIEKNETEVGPRVLRRKMPFLEVQTAKLTLARSRYEPEFLFLVDTAVESRLPEALAATVESFRRQKWERWQLVLRSNSKHTSNWIAHLLADEYRDVSDRIRLLDISVDGRLRGKAPSSSLSTSDLLADLRASIPDDDRDRLVGVLVAGDEVGVDTLLELAQANVVGDRADLLYADDRRIEPSFGTMQAFFKPDWSPDLMLSTNYLGRGWVAEPALLERLGETSAAGVYDLALRLTEEAQNIRHVTKVLFVSPELEAEAAMASALESALTRRKIAGSIEVGCVPRTFRFKRDVVQPGLVSIIIPSIAAHGHVVNCIKSIRELSTYRDVEIVIIDNIWGASLTPEQMDWKVWFQENADKVIPLGEAFNWSRFNNVGAEAAKGEYLLFLNDDVEALDPNWLEALLEHAQRPEVGVVGPQLLYPDRKVQHAGLFLSGPGMARHAFRFAAEDEPGYFGLARTQRNMIGVTGACMLMRRDAFDACGGFEEAHSVINNDLDYCLRAHSLGQLVVYQPHTKLIHHELASRAKMKDIFDNSVFLEQWRDVFARTDPYFSPHLSTTQDNYTPDAEPLRLIYAGNPIASIRDIKRILVVKLDHIGDLMTAFPAFERIKQRFPGASLSLLVGKSARGMSEYVGDVEHVFDFEFFHARSGLGEADVSDEALEALGDQLRPYDFDLAIDLRKHGDTRKVLTFTGATYLAGCDDQGEFPYLDIAMASQHDTHYVNKRQHVADDLMNLVDVVAAAFDPENEPPAHAQEALPVLSKALLERFPKLFSLPYVCLHPSAGNELRQWSPEQFATLADMLIETEGVPVAIIGGPDEAEVAGQVMQKIRNRQMVVSLVGATKLSEVPAVIAHAILFVGNNSGPSHIAGWFGTPTVSVHSAVVSSEEWAPRGRNAVAIRRDTVCSPCYRDKLQNCHRNLACLATMPVGSVLDVCRRLIRIRKPSGMAFTPPPIEKGKTSGKRPRAA